MSGGSRRAVRRAAVLAIALAACHRDHTERATTTGPGPGVSVSPAVAPSPPQRQCLPALVCLAWDGCALVEVDAAGKASVVSADHLAPGTPVRIANGCNDGSTCLAASGAPTGTTCPPVEIPPIIGPPPYRCVLADDHCRAER